MQPLACIYLALRHSKQEKEPEGPKLRNLLARPNLYETFWETLKEM